MRTEHYVDMESPLTGGRVKLIEDVEEQEFRKEKYTVYVRYYVCEDTGERFTVDGQDDFVLNQIYSQYRLTHGIPFTDEIIALRERYKLNYTQMSKILGFGTNQWKLYEQGVVPSESNGKIIVTIRNKQCMLSLLEASHGEFSDAEYNKVKANILASNDAEDNSNLRQLFYGKTERGIYNGFSAMDAIKVQSMVRYFISEAGGSICPTKLNKEMFYADFLHFRRHSQSISGLQYRAIQYGPVPEHYDTIFDNTDGVTKESVISYDIESVLLHCDTSTHINNLTNDEMETLSYVSSFFKSYKTSDIVKLSHKEDAWKNHKANHSLIPYSEAYELKALL